MARVEQAAAVQCECGENPIWVPEEKALYWVDTEKSTVFRYRPHGGILDRFSVGCDTQSIARHTANEWIVLSPTGVYFWNRLRNACSFIGNPEASRPHIRLCDCAVDPRGRLLAGTYNSNDFNAPDGSIYRMDHDLSFKRLDGGLVFVNGIAFSPQGTVMYVAEMFARRILAYTYDPESGEASDRRLFVEFDEKMGYPDGLIVDAAGFLWCGHWAGWRVTRFDRTGKAVTVVEMPVPTATCMGFGGESLDELYITTARKGLSAAELERSPASGDLFMVRPGVKGVAEGVFRKSE